MQDDQTDNPYESPRSETVSQGAATEQDESHRRLVQFAGAFFSIVGVPLYVFCGLHVCMAGHMHHPPYPWWHYATDGIWVAGLTVGAILCLVARCRLGARMLVVGLLLVASRLLLGSGGGLFFLLELPLLAVVVHAAISTLRGAVANQQS